MNTNQLTEVNIVTNSSFLAHKLLFSYVGDKEVLHHKEYRIRPDQLEIARTGLSGDQNAEFLVIPTADCLLFINPALMVGARLINEINVPQTLETFPSEAIAINRKDIGLKEAEDDDNPPPKRTDLKGAFFYLDKDLVESDSPCELWLIEDQHDPKEYVDLAIQLRQWDHGLFGDIIHIEQDDSGEDVYLNANHIALIEFKLEEDPNSLCAKAFVTLADYLHDNED
ncbi:MAG: hypothetical protein KKC20_24805 [Proteobacteria bacterium]|nr:hypothetical protein [Pseudomonadota bacterium]